MRGEMGGGDKLINETSIHDDVTGLYIHHSYSEAVVLFA